MQYNVQNDDLDVESEDQHPGYTVGGTGGAHKITTVSQDTARYLIFSTKPTIDIVEYPDSHKAGFGSRGRGSRMVREGESLDYWDGE